MEKIIELSDGKLLIQTDNNGYVPFITIKKAYINSNYLQKIITFSMWDDFQFDAYTKDDFSKLFFEFEYSDPLYSELDTLLGEDKEIIIDDDNTSNKMKKFMIILRKEESIAIEFIGDATCELTSQKFNVFIKNIGPDARSKIQNSDLKIRLIDFFENCKKSLLKEENISYKLKK